MKRLWIIPVLLVILTVCILLIPKPLDASTLVGKTVEDISRDLTLSNSLFAYGYGFGTDRYGNPVVLEFETDENGQNRVVKAVVFSRKSIDASAEGLAALEPGMSIYQVVEKVGIPTDIPATGLFLMEFTDSSGKTYALHWTGDPITLAGIYSE